MGMEDECVRMCMVHNAIAVVTVLAHFLIERMMMRCELCIRVEGKEIREASAWRMVGHSRLWK